MCYISVYDMTESKLKHSLYVHLIIRNVDAETFSLIVIQCI